MQSCIMVTHSLDDDAAIVDMNSSAAGNPTASVFASTGSIIIRGKRSESETTGSDIAEQRGRHSGEIQASSESTRHHLHWSLYNSWHDQTADVASRSERTTCADVIGAIFPKRESGTTWKQRTCWTPASRMSRMVCLWPIGSIVQPNTIKSSISKSYTGRV